MFSRRLVLSAALSLLALASSAPSPGQAAPNLRVARVTDRIDESRLMTIPGSVHPALASATDLGMVTPDLAMNRMQLVLKRSPELQAAVDAFVEQQYDPKSPNFHHWLSADEFGQRFGVADADISVISAWLGSHGFTVNSVSKSRLTIEFSGTASQVQSAFHTEMHRYAVNGETHLANASAVQIPEALSSVVVGLQSLNDFRAHSQAIQGGQVQLDPATRKFVKVSGTSSLSSLAAAGGSPLYTATNGEHYLSPYDFATIYNAIPAWTAGTVGTGVSIAIAGRSDIYLSDVATFQSRFGLPINPPTIIHNGPAPGTGTSSASFGEQAENTLDVEWSGAAAPGAKINLVVSSSTATSDGFVLSAQYIVDNQIASIMSSSYGQCELGQGTAGNAFINALWQQAAAEGISSFVSSGDEASAGCDSSSTTPYRSHYGLQVNGVASTPYNTAVGGTDFGLSEFNNGSTYWNSTTASNGSSAKSYIPEVPWNDMCTSSVVQAIEGYSGLESGCNTAFANTSQQFLVVNEGGSGGVSACTTNNGSTVSSCTGGYAKPSWQTGTGVPADGKRDLPDVSLFAAPGFVDAGYLVEFKGTLSVFGGTSVASPAMAGIMALVVQKQGSAQGLANPVFYKLAANQNTSACSSDTVATGNACTFFDTTTGNINVPCLPASLNCVTNVNTDLVGILSGYGTTAGYDLATGLGTVNVTNLVNNWGSIVGSPSTTITISPTTLPNPSLSAPYSQQITAGGGVAPYNYTVISGALPPGVALTPDGLLSGVPSLVGAYTFTIAATDSSVNGPYSGSQAYTVTVGPALTASTISWSPATNTIYTGTALGANVLNAMSALPGTISYTALLNNDASPSTVTQTTVLPAGNYTLSAMFTPTGGSTATATVSIPFNVIPEHVWVVNSAGNVSILDAGGNAVDTAITGGGLGIAIDKAGTAWSASTSGSSLQLFSNFLNVGNTYISPTAYGTAVTGGGLSGATALAADGNGWIWVANSNGTVSVFSNLGVALTPSTGANGGNLSSPSGIAVDISGNVWVANKGNNSVTEILGAAAPTLPLTPAVVVGTPGVKP
jgi:hypothetical protein